MEKFLIENTFNRSEVMKKNLILRIKNKINHGLFMHGFINRFQRMGIEIKPYYWENEYIKPCDPPTVRGGSSEYSIKIFGSEEIKYLCSNGYEYNEKEKLEDLKNGQLWIGLMHNNKIAAYSWVQLNEMKFREVKIKLNNSQAYLGGMFTMESHRGRNLAPFLRYSIYKFLNEEGRDDFYSITDYYNYSSLKFKKKLNSKHLKLHIYFNLFKKYRSNFVLKKYE
jgi:hypothetical protein